MSTFLYLLFIGVSVSSQRSQVPHLTVLYNSQGLDAQFQLSLAKGTFLGLRDVENRHALLLESKLLDLGSKGTALDWTLQNSSGIIISLLSSSQLYSVCSELKATLRSSRLTRQIQIFTPRNMVGDECGPLDGDIKVTSLQIGQDGRILALLHRIIKVGTISVQPVLDNESQLGLLARYEKFAFRMKSNLRFLKPILMFKSSFRKSWEPSLFSRKENATGVSDSGILLLSTQGLTPEIRSHLVETEHFFRWFSHEGTHEWNSTLDILGLYSVQYVGSGNWDNVNRRRLLKEFNTFTGPNPAILSAVLAYDIAILAVNRHLPYPQTSGLSGDFRFNQGSRAQGTFFGISRLPRSKGSSASVLQPSDWILEDLLEVKSGKHGEITLGDYQVATSSILSRHELLKIGQESKGSQKCNRVEMEVLTHDPFNQQEYRFKFVPSSLPQHLLIPNQYGYGLAFRCVGKESRESVILRIACVPEGKSIGEPVHCYKSDILSRNKRNPTYKPYGRQGIRPQYQSRSHYSKGSSNYSPREDTSIYYQQGPPDNSFTYYNPQDSSTPATLTTRLDVPINEEVTHPPTGGSKLPELRQILKAAKPFVGSCIGSTSGCAVCVLVLGRLPLGAVPAACTGPCFVGTFGTCGSLLGRVFSETTVICTELFRQGLLDLDTFIADAEFGQDLAKYEPEVLLGYQVLATPLVQKMKESEIVTRLVTYFALPWAKHMKYLRGHSDEVSLVGYIIHLLGSSSCYLLGSFLTCLHSEGGAASMGYCVGALLFGFILVFRRFSK